MSYLTSIEQDGDVLEVVVRELGGKAVALFHCPDALADAIGPLLELLRLAGFPKGEPANEVKP